MFERACATAPTVSTAATRVSIATRDRHRLPARGRAVRATVHRLAPRGWFGERASSPATAARHDGVGDRVILRLVLNPPPCSSSLRRPRTKIARGDYDLTAVGWPNRAVAPDDAPAWVYDTSQPGYANTVQLFGDRLTPADRSAVLEYLKTL
jgi:hypothetical protein